MASARLKVPDFGSSLILMIIANGVWIKFETLVVPAKIMQC